jgi:hypothetical protein
MKTNCNIGLLLPSLLLSLGGYLIYNSIAESEWYRDVYLIVGATVLTIGLMIVCWEIQRYFSIRRVEQHVRKFR